MLVLLIFGLVCYALASVFMLLSFLAKKGNFDKVAKVFSLGGFIVLTLLLVKVAKPAFAENAIISKDLYFYGFSWFLTLILATVGYKIKNNFLLLISSPLLFVLLHTAMLAERSAEMAYVPLGGMLFLVHILAISIALILVLISGVASILFLIQEKSMKMKMKASNFMKLFPSLEALDKINYTSTLVGFPCYTIGLACGFIWAGSAWGAMFSGDIKEITSLIIWTLYAILFHARIGLSYKGKKPALLAITICALSIFSLLGVNTLFSTHHNF